MNEKLSPHTADYVSALHCDYVAYLKKLLLDIVQIKHAIARGETGADTLGRLHHLIHNLCGNGSTFGFPDITRSGQRLALMLKPYLESAQSEWLPLIRSPAFTQALEQFERICHQAALSGAQDARQASPAATAAPAEERRMVAIFSPPGGAVQDMDEQLRHFGYQVSISQDIAAYVQDIRAHTPDVLIVHSQMHEDDVTALSALTPLLGEAGSLPQFIMVSPNESFEAKLAAVRLGAQGYFTMPADVLQVIDKIEQLVAQTVAAPSYHVLIVDDDEMLMKFYTHALMRSGIIATSVSSPKDALNVIGDQAVDLILIDYLMPGCNGRELATIIRQHEKYVSLPIIFMSARDDVEALLINTGLGIDDFLVKPITGDQLVSVVRSRARRSAELQALMARDSFTGLLNHGHFMDMLAMELGQAKRYRTSGAYALIDIDRFKQINDTYGHIAGDHVIKGLSRMLQQRLRRSDIIGRCGGEEFGIIMPDCDLPNASLIVESLRLQFADIGFKMENGEEIHVTFSAGLTALDAHGDVDTLIRTADKALYEAKNSGRNRLVIA